MNFNQTRRQFIGQSSTALAGLGFLGLNARSYGRTIGANDKLVLGVIGCGGIANHNTGKLMAVDNVEFAAVCDVDSRHMDAHADKIVKGNRGNPKKFKDFRRLLEMKEIDAVVINTPDHWHALPFIAACEAGKDIYCEKPISHSFIEAKAMINAALRFRTVVQVGTWQRSMKHFQDAIDYVKSGKLGTVSICRAWSVNGKEGWLQGIGRQQPQAVPAELDWDMWLGPAPKRAYQPNRCHFTWRWFFDYGGGLMTDWGVHMIDIALLGMGEADPQFVSSVGGKFAIDDDRDTPDTMQAFYQFPKFTLQWEHRFNNGRGLDGGKGHGAEFIGDKGTLIVDREGWQLFPEKKDEKTEKFDKQGESTHWQNFVDCVKSRKTPASGIESMGKTTMLCHLGNIALQANKVVHWDAKKQEVRNRGDVKHCLSYEREYRKPWKLKMWKV